MPDVLELDPQLDSRAADKMSADGTAEGRTIEASARPCDCSRPVDLVHLARYTLGDRTLEREVLELFQSHSRLQLDQLVAAVGDANKWRDAAHAIKGSARGIGAWSLASAAEEAEAASGQPDALQRSLADDVDRAMSEANSYIDTLFAP